MQPSGIEFIQSRLDRNHQRAAYHGERTWHPRAGHHSGLLSSPGGPGSVHQRLGAFTGGSSLAVYAYVVLYVDHVRVHRQ
ncbi:MAG TPA: hypothetical protein H9786_08320 [Candidatus Brachybacterium merdavium]|uniref:Uncharacterized protein n=1 Tax=Candidatus Brachybacterium merdavium TaxID=2838513 RepID=A0A9D2RQ26_9MICO|nr:hypothetical protein [Candidatus Brachybacterium merdavium]